MRPVCVAPGAASGRIRTSNWPVPRLLRIAAPALTERDAMHIEPLEKLPRSVREFLSHYAMIVLSILTALALEQVALGLEHRHEGARAKEEIEQEIASNHQRAVESLHVTEENGKAWR